VKILGVEKSMGSIFLDKVYVNRTRVDYFFSVSEELQKYFNKNNHFFLEYNYDITDIPESIITVPFVSNIIPLIWLTNSTLNVKELDKSFFMCLNEIRNSYQEMFPNTSLSGNIIVQTILENTYTPEVEAATLFSGGLDAVTTFIRTKEKRPILITEYGWHKEDLEYSEVWEADKNNAIDFANRYNLENILIQSNYGTFINAQAIDADFSKKLQDTWWHGLHHGLAIISAPIPVAFKLKVGCIYIASSNSPLLKVSCASDPTIDNKVRYGSGTVYHDGYELNRQEKIKVLVDYSKRDRPINIRVCFKNESNCCRCEKCLRTIFGIIAEGMDPAEFGFSLVGSSTYDLKTSLNNEVKFFTDIFIKIYWNLIQERMKVNSSNVLYPELLKWFLKYNFLKERRKALLIYRITNFLPILKRKILIKLNNLLTEEL
jgi:hypothetical protein